MNIAHQPGPQPTFVIREVTDPVELAQAQAQRERFDRNLEWFSAHVLELGQTYRGKHLVIAGQEVFAGDTSAEAWASARAVHPDDDGAFHWFIRRERLVRIYAHQRQVAGM